MNAINSNSNSYVSWLPSIRLSTPKEMLTKITLLALPIIALVSSIQAQSADAGPIAYAACISICGGATLGAFLPACAVACAPALVAPTP